MHLGPGQGQEVVGDHGAPDIPAEPFQALPGATVQAEGAIGLSLGLALFQLGDEGMHAGEIPTAIMLNLTAVKLLIAISARSI